MTLVHDLTDMLESKRQEITDWMNKNVNKFRFQFMAVSTYETQVGKLEWSMRTTFQQVSTMSQMMISQP